MKLLRHAHPECQVLDIEVYLGILLDKFLSPISSMLLKNNRRIIEALTGVNTVKIFGSN